MYDSHKNFVSTSVVTAPSPANSGTSLTITAGSGSRFPTPPFNCVVYPNSIFPTHLNTEIVRVTNVSTDTLTIVRAQENSTTRSITAGDIIAMTVTAKVLTDIETELDTVKALAEDALPLTGGALTGALSVQTYVDLHKEAGLYGGPSVQTGNITLSNSLDNSAMRLDYSSSGPRVWGTNGAGSHSYLTLEGTPLLLNPFASSGFGGNVGINELSPSYQLDVNGYARFGVATSDTRLVIGSEFDPAVVSVHNLSNDTCVAGYNTTTAKFLYGTNDGNTGITIDGNGYVGISSSSPILPLDVTGNAVFRGSNNDNQVNIGNLLYTDVWGINNNSNDQIIAGFNTTTNKFLYGTGDTGAGGITIDNENAKIGINTGSPTTTLDVNGTATTQGLIIDNTTGPGSFLQTIGEGGSEFIIYSSTAASNVLRIDGELSAVMIDEGSSSWKLGIGILPQHTLDVKGAIGSSDGNDYYIGFGGGDSYFNANGGNVGISTQFPQETLDVVGTIKSKGLIVEPVNPLAYSLPIRMTNGTSSLWTQEFVHTTEQDFSPPRWFVAPTSNYVANTEGNTGGPGLYAYAWNLCSDIIPGENRFAVGVCTLFGATGEFGSKFELLTRRAEAYENDSGVFNHNLVLDAYGHVGIGNNPESEHTIDINLPAWCQIRPATADAPQLWLEQSAAFTGTEVNGHFRCDGTSVWLTQDGTPGIIATAANVEAMLSSTLSAIGGQIAALEAQPRLYIGDNSPEGVVAAAPGSIYTDKLNGAQYTKYTGTGNTGWV
jgi:hypothetical protein